MSIIERAMRKVAATGTFYAPPPSAYELELYRRSRPSMKDINNAMEVRGHQNAYNRYRKAVQDSIRQEPPAAAPAGMKRGSAKHELSLMLRRLENSIRSLGTGKPVYIEPDEWQRDGSDYSVDE